MFTIVYVFLLVYFLGNLLYVRTINKKIKSIQSWPTTTGKVIVSVLEEKVDGHGVGIPIFGQFTYQTTNYTKQYRPRVQYEYNTSMFEDFYYGNKVSYEGKWTDDILKANALLVKFQKSSAVKVYYSPQDNRESYIMLDEQRDPCNVHTLICLFVASLFLSLDVSATSHYRSHRYGYYDYSYYL